MEYKKYLIKKGKTDLLSSLKLVDKKIINERLEEEEIDSLEELKNIIIEDFGYCLSTSKDDIFTRIYFEKILKNENSMWMSIYEIDVESLWAFVYQKNGYYSYYIPTEIKEIIKKELNIK